MDYSREDSYQRSFCIRSCIVRPMPKGIKVYLVLLQFVLYEIASYSIELYLAGRFNPFLITQRYWKQYMDTDEKEVPEEFPSIFLALRSLHLMLCLPMGFLADRYYGRTKVLVYSWILVFIIECIFTMHVTLFEVYVSEYLDDSSYIALTVLIIALHAVGLAGVHVNLISYGVDQLVGAFADELSSYFHWYYWCRSAGVFIVCTCGTYILAFFNSGYVLLMATASCGVAVVTNLLGTGWFIKAEKVGNTLLLIYRVLRYAAVAKPPGQRSAFSYDDRPKPSRIDLVKETHHGYIKDEKVEDVKVFLKILGILFSLLGFFCVSFLVSCTEISGQLYTMGAFFESYKFHKKIKRKFVEIIFTNLHWCCAMSLYNTYLLVHAC